MAGRRQAAIALGSNLGDRLGNLLAAVRALAETDQVRQLSRLYESAPAYVTDQPPFLNAAALVGTSLPPLELLRRLKDIEARLGRDLGPAAQRWGPRPIDLDIVFYEGQTVTEGETLVVPHPRWQERDFVKAPLADLCSAGPGSSSGGGASGSSSSSGGGASGSRGGSSGSEAGTGQGGAAGDGGPAEFSAGGGSSSAGGGRGEAAGGGLQRQLRLAASLWAAAGGERQLGTPDLECVLPMGRLGLWPWQRRTQVMGILNVTPDSFSDGGRHNGSVAAAVAHAAALAEAGADILDIGGQSTRPGSELLTAEQEKERILPVIRALMQEERLARMPLSVDTFYADVAAAAVEAGATMVNDVSGGTLDPGMHAQVAELNVPYVLMHMRGTPQDMQQRRHTRYGDVVADVAAELAGAAQRATAAGIEPWRLVLDPGLGFAKTQQGNLQLMAQLPALRAALPPPLGGLPLLLGPSRKGFLGKLTGRERAADRDFASAAAAALCVAGGANIIRAHNVEAVRDAVRVADAVRPLLVPGLS
ncbi:hypothetical protein ABPG75_010431 [Micractinium tetrahymenae]